MTRLSTLTPEQRQQVRRLAAQRAQRQPPIVKRPGSQPAPASYQQQAMWLLQHLQSESARYHLIGAVVIRSDVHAGRLAEAFRHVIDHHEILRTTFHDRDGQIVQDVHAAIALPLVETDITDVAIETRDDEIRRRAAMLRREPFVLETGPLMRVELLRCDDRHHVCLVAMHHIITDGWSMGILLRDALQAYQDLSAGRRPAAPPLALQYGDYAQWQRGQSFDAAVQAWMRDGGGELPVMTLPLDRPRSAAQARRGARESHVLSIDLSARLRERAQASGLSPFMILFAGFAALLQRCTDQDELLIGLSSANRTQLATEPMIGYFVNQVPVRVRVSGATRGSDLMQHVRQQLLHAYEHQDVPLDKLVAELRLDRRLGENPLLQVGVVHHVPLDVPDHWGEMGVTFLDMGNEEAELDLLLRIATPRSGSFELSLDYCADLFERRTARRLLDRYARLLGEMLGDPSQPIGRVSLIDATERQTVVRAWNQTTTVYTDGDRGLGELIERALLADPDRVAAVMDGGAHWSAATLLTEARRIAGRLTLEGVEPGAVVGICAERSLARVAAVLGVVGAGAAYLPLDPSYPVARLRQMLGEARPTIVLVGPDVPVTERDAQAGTRLVPLDACATQSPGAFRAVRGFAPAYVIYTSGSTGRPKGAANTHAGIVNRLLWMQEAYPLGADDAVLQKTPFGFDVSVWEFFWPVLAGARLVIATPGVQADPEALAALVQRERVTTMHFVPSMLARYLEAASATGTDGVLRQVIASGEALPRATVQRFHAVLPSVALHNLYGPTEAAIDVTAWTCDDDANGDVPIGRPIANTQVYVLDEALQPVGMGMPGDLYLGGVGLALGYYGQGARTAQRFVPDPFAGDARGRGTRLYDTGDRAQWRADGLLQYLGRRDGQVKIRGNRVELGEIERVLASHPTVRQAAAHVQTGSGDGSMLAAYVTPATVTSVAVTSAAVTPTGRAPANDAAPQPAELRRWLATQLPAFMVPSAIVVLDALPLSPNGKLDRRALPPVTFSSSAPIFAAPQGALEEQLAAVWQEVLRVERVGRHDNFFDLGGDSIRSLQIVSRANAAGLALTLRQVFEHQTIADLAAVVVPKAAAAAAAAAIDEAPLTPIQRWFFAQRWTFAERFHQLALVATAPGVRGDWLQAAVAAAQASQDALRLRIADTNGTRTQVVSTTAPSWRTLRVDRASWPEALTEAGRGAVDRLDPSAGHLGEWIWIEGAEGEGGRLLGVLHHLAIDGVSWRILFEDIAAAYAQQAAGNAITVRPPAVSYLQWATELARVSATTDWRAEREYWTRETADACPVPIDSVGANPATEAETLTQTLSATETRALQRWPDSGGGTVQDALLAALASAVGAWVGAPRGRVLVDVEGHGRQPWWTDLDLSRTVGWFTTIAPLAVQWDTAWTPAQALSAVQTTRRQQPRHGLGYDVLTTQTTQQHDAFARLPRASICLNYLGDFDSSVSTDGVLQPAPESIVLPQPEGVRPWLLELSARVAQQQLHLTWSYHPSLHRRDTVQRVANGVLAALRRLLDAPAPAPAPRVETDSRFALANLAPNELQLVLDRIRAAQTSHAETEAP